MRSLYEKLFMTVLVLLSIAVLTVPFVCSAQQNGDLPEVQVVDNLDIERYMGTWYLIAALPSVFERQCAEGTTATYTLNADGTVTVLNACYRANGMKYQREGRAFVVDETTNAKLEVSFVRLFGLWPFRGRYWVMEVGENYEYAVVGHPTRDYGWILSRTCSLSDDVLQGIKALLESQYYNFDDFVFNDQSKNGCVPE